MQSILSVTQKVIDQSNGKNLLFLPLDKAKVDGTAAAAAAAAVDERPPARPASSRGGGQ